MIGPKKKPPLNALIRTGAMVLLVSSAGGALGYAMTRALGDFVSDMMLIIATAGVTWLVARSSGQRALWDKMPVLAEKAGQTIATEYRRLAMPHRAKLALWMAQEFTAEITGEADKRRKRAMFKGAKLVPVGAALLLSMLSACSGLEGAHDFGVVLIFVFGLLVLVAMLEWLCWPRPEKATAPGVAAWFPAEVAG